MVNCLMKTTKAAYEGWRTMERILLLADSHQSEDIRSYDDRLVSYCYECYCPDVLHVPRDKGHLVESP